MLRRVLPAGLAVATLFTLTSCGGSQGPSRPLPSSPTGPPSGVTAAAQAIPVTTTWSCFTQSAAGTTGIFAAWVWAVSCPAQSRVVVFDAATAVPGAPSNLTSSVAGGTVTLTWQSATSLDPATSYVIEASLDQFATLVAAFDTLSTATAFTVTGVPSGRYYVRVRARNSAGTGPSTPVASVIVADGPCTGPPRPPAALRFTRLGTQLNMEWNPVAGASEYVIEAGSVTDGRDIFIGSAGLNTTFTAIIPETTHAYVRVYARNACGTSLRGDEIEIGAMWSVSFPAQAGLNANACVPDIAPGGLCSQVLRLRSFGQFDEIWSPATPVMRVRGVMTATEFTATATCLNGAASGSLQATWNGERYVGTGTLGGSTATMRVTLGTYDPQCLAR